MPDQEGLAELHTHLGGSVASKILGTLAHEQGIALSVKDYSTSSWPRSGGSTAPASSIPRCEPALLLRVPTLLLGLSGRPDRDTPS